MAKLSSDQVDWACGKREAGWPSEQRSYVGRDGRSFRTYTPAEDERLLTMARRGDTVGQIASAMQRGRTSVSMRIMLLERREELPA